MLLCPLNSPFFHETLFFANPDSLGHDTSFNNPYPSNNSLPGPCMWYVRIRLRPMRGRKTLFWIALLRGLPATRTHGRLAAIRRADRQR